jgi:hypothetical protein
MYESSCGVRNSPWQKYGQKTNRMKFIVHLTMIQTMVKKIEIKGVVTTDASNTSK